MSIRAAIFSHLKGAHDVAFTADASTNVITAAGHGRVNGDKLRVSSAGTLPGGLSSSTDYYVIEMSGSTFKLSETSGGGAVDITSAGSGAHTLETAVSQLVEDRIYFARARQDTPAPYIVYRVISESRQQHIGGVSGLVTARIQFDIFSSDPDNAIAIVAALRGMLDGYDRAMGAAGLDVRLIWLESIADGFPEIVHGDEIGLHHVIMDIFATYAESIPIH